ncbi:DUF4276 family protein [Stutzerimonas stutzeri]|uniref:DUF4276 family protein n=1 Tax=Stutzerimonas stutzeri TaxID=316 RepID=UPI00210B53AC|nr:DUF4276 family protein [Stutzerimonas stutzeri]MCQ4261168.1 DUF4276 family protein [Stutzerimonas stutzeri]
MHIEIVVEDSSGSELINSVITKIIGELGEAHTWRVHPYKGIGRIPKNLSRTGDPANRVLLQQLPKLLKGYGRTPGVDAVVVVLDSDRKDCRDFLKDLTALANECQPNLNVMFRIAVEEMEAWYLGDRHAIMCAYRKAKIAVLERYEQDSVCGTWELLADAIYPGGMKAIRKTGWPLPGQIKHEWAKKISPFLNIEENESPSFCKLRDGLRRLTGDS